MSTTKNLWGELPLAEAIRTPAIILREQATQLNDLTKGLLEGEVVSGKTSNSKLYHKLNIVAPSLDGYKYAILYVTHGVIAYPCDVLDETSRMGYKCEDEQYFVEVVAKILSSAPVHKAVSALLAQSKSELPSGL